MSHPADAQALLTAVARCLAEQVEPALRVADRGLAFRVRIAAHLAGTVARELALGPAADAAALGRLCGIYGAPQASTEAERQAQQRALSARLASDLRADRLAPAALADARAHIRQQLQAELAINAPRFDLRPDVESAR